MIPGTKKDTLYKPGAELIMGWHKIYEDPTVLEHTEEWGTEKDKYPFFHFLVRSTIYQYIPGLNGEPVRVELGSAIGEANTGESRYSHRWMWPNQMSDAMHKQAKAEDWPTKETRNGSKQYKMTTPKEEIRSQYNTVLKMAQIRALRSSLAKVCATSEFFGDEDDYKSGGAPKASAVATEKSTTPTPQNSGDGTAEDPEVIPPKSNVKAAAELKFLKDILKTDAEKFKSGVTKLFDDKYTGKAWKDWAPEDITALKDLLAQGEMPAEGTGDHWGEEEKSSSEGPSNEPEKMECATCKTPMEQDRFELYDGVPGGAQCTDCAKKAQDQKVKTALNR